MRSGRTARHRLLPEAQAPARGLVIKLHLKTCSWLAKRSVHAIMMQAKFTLECGGGVDNAQVYCTGGPAGRGVHLILLLFLQIVVAQVVHKTRTV